VDLNNDGYADMVSGKYYPNNVTWFKGSKDGFEEGVEIKEERRKIEKGEKNQRLGVSMYKCTPRFADIDGDKDLDLFVTDFTSVYLNKNVGTPETPKFGRREFIITTKGDTIGGSSPTVAIVDWDRDGISDLLVADNSDATISFYKGNRNGVFEPGKPIYKNKKSKKFIPGESYWIYPTDWNNDGLPDLLVGTRIAYKDGKIDKEMNTQKGFMENLKKGMSRDELMKFYKTIKNYGHVYLLQGK